MFMKNGIVSESKSALKNLNEKGRLLLEVVRGIFFRRVIKSMVALSPLQKTENRALPFHHSAVCLFIIRILLRGPGHFRYPNVGPLLEVPL